MEGVGGPSRCRCEPHSKPSISSAFSQTQITICNSLLLSERTPSRQFGILIFTATFSRVQAAISRFHTTVIKPGFCPTSFIFNIQAFHVSETLLKSNAWLRSVSRCDRYLLTRSPVVAQLEKVNRCSMHSQATFTTLRGGEVQRKADSRHFRSPSH